MLVCQIRNPSSNRGGVDLVQRRQGPFTRRVFRHPRLFQIMQKAQDLVKLFLRQRSKSVTYLVYSRFLNGYSTQPFKQAASVNARVL
jgi:hypothetical protein